MKASETTIMKSMVGDYLREHLFTLRQYLMAYRNYQQLIADCDKEIGIQLGQFNDNADLQAKPLPPPEVRRGKIFNNAPSFDLRGRLYRISGVDLTAAPGINAVTEHTLLAEIGPDLSEVGGLCLLVGAVPG